jgi:hypothetical protein
MVHRPTLSTTERAAIRSRVESEEAQKARERAELVVKQIEHQRRRIEKKRESLAREAKILPSQCRASGSCFWESFNISLASFGVCCCSC